MSTEKETFVARTNEDKTRTQTLSEHLMNVAKLSALFSDCPHISCLIAMLHDLGKITSKFQDYIINGGRRGSVVHSLQGAFFLEDLSHDSKDVAEILVKEIAELVIVAHHGALDDAVSTDGQKTFFQRFEKKENSEYSYQEVKDTLDDFSPEFTTDVDRLFDGAKKDVDQMIDFIETTYKIQKFPSSSSRFALGLFVKYIFSCLIDADRLDAYLFDIEEEYKSSMVDWSEIIEVFEEKVRGFEVDSKIGSLRMLVSNQCKEAGKSRNTGIYQLSVPTGGGKTLSSLRFALHHCKKNDKKRIIYVIPYLSIIEQTALELRKILDLPEDNDVILESHSNIVLPDEEEEQRLRKLAASRFDRPIIITTMVQFLETAMSSRGGTLRKFHNMSDAVIIFDEIQSLPIKSIHLFNETVSFLSKILNTTIVLCTATQPQLNKTERENLMLESNPNLVQCDGLFEDLKRTRIVPLGEKDIDGFSTFVLEQAEKCGDCLAIVNTKKSAREVFDRLKDNEDFEVYHISTFMCAQHRVDVIEKVREALDPRHKKKIICIATQLIEAGIDISFSCVVRATAGLDSVAQAAGRCNRHGESLTPKEVYVISLKGENLDRLVDIKEGKKTTERLIREHPNSDLLDGAAMKQFYQYYFFARKNQMDYPTDTGTIYDMLSLNRVGRNNYRNHTGKDCPCIISQAFRTADEKFYVIDKNTISVVVIYGAAKALIEKYNKQPRDRITREKIEIIRKLERFSISFYSWEVKQLEGAIDFLDEEMGIQKLDENYYSEDVGVLWEVAPEAYII